MLSRLNWFAGRRVVATDHHVEAAYFSVERVVCVLAIAPFTCGQKISLQSKRTPNQCKETVHGNQLQRLASGKLNSWVDIITGLGAM